MAAAPGSRIEDLGNGLSHPQIGVADRCTGLVVVVRATGQILLRELTFNRASQYADAAIGRDGRERGTSLG